MTEKRENIDIVALIRDHPLNKLSGNYESNIINKIKEQFSTEEQQLFIANFYCYTNYDNETEFVVEFDNVWKMLEFTRIDHCKNVLNKNFTENKDYIIGKHTPATSGASSHGGNNKEKILLTVNCFKKLCLKAGTKKADEIHDYYIKLEKIINQVAREESEVLVKQLQIKDTEINKTKLDNQNNLLLNFDKKNVVYIIRVEENILKFGHTQDIKTRFTDHKNEFGQDIKLLYIFESIYNREFELMIKKDKLLKKYIVDKKYKKNQTELIQLDTLFTEEELVKRMNELKKLLNGDLISNLIKENDELKLKVSEQALQIVEKDAQIAKLYRMHSIDTIDFPLISYNITTKKEIEHDNLTKVQHTLKTSITTLRHYIDKHKQFQGYVLRSGYNKPYWVLPENFKFSNAIGQTTQNVFIKRVDKVTNEVVYYNSISEAAMFLQQEIDNKDITELTDEASILRKALGELLRGFPTRKPIVNKYYWYKMKEIGFIVSPDGSKVCIDESETPEKLIVEQNIPEKPSQEYTDKMFENKIPIIVRNIYTGEENVFAEGWTHSIFYEKYKISKENLNKKYLNKQLNYMNLTFRTLEQPYWQIPENYKNDDENANIRLGYFIKVEDIKPDSINVYYFNSISGIANHMFPDNPKKRNLEFAIQKKFSKDSINSTTKTTAQGEFSKILCNYKWTKLESCGSLIYPDGNVVNIEKVIK